MMREKKEVCYSFRLLYFDPATSRLCRFLLTVSHLMNGQELTTPSTAGHSFTVPFHIYTYFSTSIFMPFNSPLPYGLCIFIHLYTMYAQRNFSS